MEIEPLQFGATVEGVATAFKVWAPSKSSIVVTSPDGARWPLTRLKGGWHGGTAPLAAGDMYRLLVDGQTEVPDPASRAQDGDVHGYSVVVDHSRYPWKNTDWTGRPWHEAVIYELHPGLLGGFEGIEAHLEELCALGITAIELMPISDFAGPRNWGYDGVLPYAPDSAYGSPDQLKHLIDAAHGLGLMVFLDVVYNHFGPDGNCVSVISPEFFREDIDTPWGAAINFRRTEVRAFFTESAIQWITEYRFDGLRFDAVHAITESDWLDEMARCVREAAGARRHVHLVLENDDNNAEHLRPDRSTFDAQWNDDAHHVLHVLLTDEVDGYYADYADEPASRLARILSEGFAYQGEASIHRKGAKRGTPSAGLPPTAFVDCLQNHDQIGNRPLGERLISLCDPQALKAATALLLLSPHVPLLFMGEELGSCDPFLYFTSHGQELADLVREGRRNEFAGFEPFTDKASRERIPDPNDPRTFDASRPKGNVGSAFWRSFYQQLLKLRADRVVPGLPGARSTGARVLGVKAVAATWRLGDGALLVIGTNLDSEAVQWNDPPSLNHVLYSTAESTPGWLAARCTAVYLTAPVDRNSPALAAEAGQIVERRK